MKNSSYIDGRNSNVELLRLIAIYLVILGHAFRHGIIDDNILEISKISHTIYYILSSGGGIANRIFIIITGFYSINRMRFNAKRFTKLVVIDHFYSLICCIIVYGFGVGVPSIKMIIESLFPVYFGFNWFISCYILLLICIPVINAAIQNMGVKNISRIMIVLVIIRYLFGGLWAKTFMSVGNSLEEFIIVYLIGAIISLNIHNNRIGVLAKWLMGIGI